MAAISKALAYAGANRMLTGVNATQSALSCRAPP